MIERDWRVITHTRYRWCNAEPWPWRRDVWTRCHPYPMPLWVRLLNRRKPFNTMHDHPGFYRHGSPVMRRYHAWSEQRRREIFAQVKPWAEAGLPDG